MEETPGALIDRLPDEVLDMILAGECSGADVAMWAVYVRVCRRWRVVVVSLARFHGARAKAAGLPKLRPRFAGIALTGSVSLMEMALAERQCNRQSLSAALERAAFKLDAEMVRVLARELVRRDAAATLDDIAVLAAGRGRLDVLQLLVDHGADDFTQMMIEAASWGQIEELEWLIEQENQFDESFWWSLQAAENSGERETALWLLDKHRAHFNGDVIVNHWCSSPTVVQVLERYQRERPSELVAQLLLYYQT